MKDGLRFVDCDMHIMEPPDLFTTYLDPQCKDRVVLPVGADGQMSQRLDLINQLLSATSNPAAVAALQGAKDSLSAKK